MPIPCSKTSKGATLPRGGFSSRLITDLCQMDHKTTLPHCGLPPLHCCWLIHLKCTGRAAMPVTYLHFKCPRLKRIWMIRSFQRVPLLCHVPFIWGSLLETTQTEIPQAACKLLILPLILVGFWHLPFYQNVWYFSQFLSLSKYLKISDCPIQNACPQISEMSVYKIQCKLLTLNSHSL